MEIIKKYAMSWKCCWSFFNLDDGCNVKKARKYKNKQIC